MGQYALTVDEVPVDGFWSISVYNAEGYVDQSDPNSNSINSVTATPNPDGSITVNFGECAYDRPNCVPITAGWNYVVRLYRPHPEILDGTWSFPPSEGTGTARPDGRQGTRHEPDVRSWGCEMSGARHRLRTFGPVAAVVATLD